MQEKRQGYYRSLTISDDQWDNAVSIDLELPLRLPYLRGEQSKTQTAQL